MKETSSIDGRTAGAKASVWGPHEDEQSNIHILLVDDQPANILALEAILENPRYNLVTASSAIEALRLVRMFDFAVILTDVMMPEMDGFEFATLLKKSERTRTTPIIFLTAIANDMRFVGQGYASGAVDYLQKPLQPEIVQAKVAVFVELFRQKELIRRQALLLQAHERREKERAIAEVKKQGEQRLRTVVSHAPVVLLSLDTQGVFTLAEGKGLDSLGRGLGPVVGRSAFELYADVPWVVDSLRRTLAGETWDGEGQIGDRWFEAHFAPMRDDAGRITGVMGMGLDVTERHRATEEIQKLASLVENSSDFIGIAGIDRKIVYVNPAGQQLLGIDADEVKQTTTDQYTLPEDDWIAENEVFPAIVEHGRWSGEFAFRNFKTGERVPVHMTGFAIRDPDTGNVIGIAHCSRDIREIKRAESELRANELRFRQLADSMPQIVFTTRADGTVDYFNRRWYDVTGMSPGTVASLDDAEIYHPDDVELIQSAWTKALRTGELLQCEFRLRDSVTGLYRWQLSRAVPIRDEGGAVTRWFGTSTDIDLQKKAEERQRVLADASRTLAESTDYRATLRGLVPSIVEHLADACVLFMDADSGAPAMAHSRESPAEFAAALASLTHAFDRREDAERGASKVLRTGESDFIEKVTEDHLAKFATNDAHLAALRALEMESYICVPLKRRQRVFGALGMMTRKGRRFTRADIEFAEELAQRIGIAVDNKTLYEQAKKAEAEVRDLNEALERRVVERTAQLEAANKELEAFSYSVSHDLRAPLRGIDGFSQILADKFAGQLGEQGQGYLQRVRAASQRMGHLIDDMLSLSRVTRSEMRFHRVDLSAVVQSIVQDLQQREPERDVDLRIQDGVYARVDERLIRVALENLLGNAWKFTSKRSHAVIEFGVDESGEEPVYFVRDDGAGFNMEYSDKLFGAFQRLHRVSDFPGTGVGLATVQRVVHRHGGSIGAKAAVDQGATFFFTLGDNNRIER